MLKINSDGFDDTFNELKGPAANLESMEGTHSVDADEIFNVQFMARYTKFASVDDMIEAAGLAGKEDPQGPEWDQFIAANTPFKSCEEMAGKGAEEWTIRKLGL